MLWHHVALGFRHRQLSLVVHSFACLEIITNFQISSLLFHVHRGTDTKFLELRP